MLARVSTFGIVGVDSVHVCVEADVGAGLPAFRIVGLADQSVQEARERVRGAIVNSGFKFPNLRITVNLAPAHLRKAGPGFDLALAVAVLVASGQLESDSVEGCAIVGELLLSGEVLPVKGVLAIAEGARRHGLTKFLLPRSRAGEAALVGGLEVLGVGSLTEAVEVLAGVVLPNAIEICSHDKGREYDQPDMADVRGHNALIPALEVAAAGGHNIYLHGPPGTGKTMIARRMPSILPPMTDAEASEATRIHSIAGRHTAQGFMPARPFRAPHHTISSSGLVGGGAHPTPGEATLAHNGVLFLDELTEFSRPTVEALRQPLEDGRVAIARGQQLLIFPTRFMLVAAANPCPCGMGAKECRCSAADLARYQRRLSGPVLDRIDIILTVNRPGAKFLRSQAAPKSATIRERVVDARRLQLKRLANTSSNCNASMSPRMERELVAPTDAALATLDRLHDVNDLSARAHGRVLRVARTIADLGGSEKVHPEHIKQAAGYRLDMHPTRALAA